MFIFQKIQYVTSVITSYIFSLFPGVVMISCALLCDAIIGNVQEKMLKKFFASNTELVMYSYAIGFLYLLVLMTLTGSIWTGVLYVPKVVKILIFVFYNFV